MKLIMTKGLPGSGKSTWAKAQTGFKRINKDDLRKMFDNSKWSKNNEKFVLAVRDELITMAFDEYGYSVIVDDTNLHPKHEINLREIAKKFGAEFEVKDFTDVPIEECIKRDLLRFDSVGEAVIRKQYNQFLAPNLQTAKWIEGLPTAILCDIDGTLALFGDANPYDRDFLQDAHNEPVASIITRYISDNMIILLSGRKDKYRSVTEEWLKKHGIWYNYLFMRATQDIRPDYIIKKEIYDNEIKGKYNVLFVLDDRNQVVNLWRSLGLTCLQVAEGNF